jgi:hypothetical protein
MHRRYHSPFIGRFLAADPVLDQESSSSPLAWNRYTYVNGNPVRNVDPDGRILTDVLDWVGYEYSRRAWAEAASAFTAAPSLDTGLTALARFAENTFDSGALLVPAVPAIFGIVGNWKTGAEVSKMLMHPKGNAFTLQGRELTFRPDIVLSGGRSGRNVKNMSGHPPNSIVLGSKGRVWIIDEKGNAVRDITGNRAKDVQPGSGFRTEDNPAAEEIDFLRMLDWVLGAGGGGP